MARNGFETVVDIGSTISEGTFRVGRNLLRGDFRGAWNAAVDTGRTVVKESAGFVIETGAMALHRTTDLVNGVFGLSETRSPGELLTPEQRAHIERIYGTSIDYDSIRVHRGGIRGWVGMRAHAVGDDIYLPDSAFDANGDLVDLDLLSHELAHSWQFRNGGAGYLSEALISYAGSGDPYDWQAALTGLLPFDDMTPDQQAEFAMLIGIATNADGSGGVTRTGLDVALGRTATADELAYFRAIHTRLLAGDA